MVNTIAAVISHVPSGTHGRYNDPTRAEFGGMTAVDHSLNHLNYWGPRL